MNYLFTHCKLVLALLLLVATVPATANNIQVDSISLTGQNTTANFTMVEFDLAWDNSWRLPANTAPGNWDAAWVFVKYAVDSVANTIWRHATLNFVDGANDGHSVPAGVTVTTPSDGMGVFLHRSAAGSGSNDWDNIQLRWNYGTDTVSDDAIVSVKVFAIEMVYVPEGAYTIGDGAGSGFGRVHINTGNAATMPAGAGGPQMIPQGGHPAEAVTPPASNFPNGFGDFYCMKYEGSQDQYAQFLNTLPIGQSNTRNLNNYNVNRNTINRVLTPGNFFPTFTVDVPDNAANFLAWDDAAAYMDWAGLRPMTEMEYEKACRGTRQAFPNEFAWGTPGIFSTAYTLGSALTPAEIVTNPATGPFLGNCSWLSTDGTIDGPLRCGIFSASVTPANRVEAGATFYGIMEMSGNVWERVIDVTDPIATTFTGAHGDGRLATNGNANVATWPAVGGAAGTGSRGGSWNTPNFGGPPPPGPVPNNFMQTSDRQGMFADPNASNEYGFRAVRTAP